MKKLRVLVLMHGKFVPPDDISSLTPEQFVNVKTEHDVLGALRKLDHELLPLAVTDDLTPLREAHREWKPDIVFNLVEDFRGDPLLDQNVVSYLELMGVPYTGCGPRGLILARDKALSKKIVHYHHIRVPRFVLFPIGRKVRRPAWLEFPLIVKSQVEEASEGISEASLVTSDEKLTERVAFVHSRVRTSVIVEQYIEGREVYVGVVGDERMQLLPVWELQIENLRANAPNIATKTVKWNLKYQERRGVKLGPALNLPEGTERELRHATRKTYRALQLSGYARVDFRVDAQGKSYVLEANPNPDIGRGEELAAAAEAVGISYETLIQRLLNLGLKRRETRYGHLGATPESRASAPPPAQIEEQNKG